MQFGEDCMMGMTSYEQFRAKLSDYWGELNDQAKSYRNSFLVLDRLRQLYAELDVQERGFAERVLCEWVTSEDETLKFDALMLVGELSLNECLPNLQSLERRLTNDPRPGSHYELQKVQRLIDALTSQGHEG